MEVWLPRGEAEVLVELPPEARVDVVEPRRLEVKDLDDHSNWSNGELVLVDASHLRPDSIGELVECLRPAKAVVTTWLAHGTRPSPSVLSNLRAMGLTTLYDDRIVEELRDSGQITYLSPPLVLPQQLSSPEGRARMLLDSVGVSTEGKSVRVATYAVSRQGRFAGFLEQGREQPAELKDEYDLVLLSPGGHPFDRTLLQVLLCLLPYGALCRERGVIGVVAECSEGLGSKRLLEIAVSGQREQKSLEGLVLDYLESVKSRVRVVASIPLARTYVERVFGLKQAARLQEAVTAASRFTGKDIRVAVLRVSALTVLGRAAE
ncbi:MAG: hypothetical protein NZ988_03040 [Thaumarchaeota archaeon]|nr:hypothetical protein [Candidatus Calditenuaceae archaeon]MDW8187006.1 hypothetical protein [Nitrososphaerota archaeon]